MTVVLVVLSGITVSFIRFVFGLLVAIFITGIVHKTIAPMWMERLVKLDMASLSYISEVISYNQYHHPLHRGYAILLNQISTKHSHQNKKAWKVVARCGMIQAKHAIVLSI